jgi:uncharacterized iron-regulated membrane protein
MALMARRIHKYLALTFALFWIFQILTGLVLHFRYDIEDRLLGALPHEVDGAAIDRALQVVSDRGDTVDSIWISGGIEGQLDVYASKGDQTFTARVDHDGELLQIRNDAQRIGDGALWETLKSLHEDLLAGTTGQILIGASGILLVTTLSLGLVAGWRRPGQWRSITSAPKFKLTSRASILAWHRLIGFWLSLLLLPIVAAGVLLAFSSQVEQLLIAPEVEIERDKALGEVVPAGQAVDRALARFPGSRFTSIDIDRESASSYFVTVHAPGEIPRSYGKTSIAVGIDGVILKARHATDVPFGEAMVEALYPFHTGQIGWWPGRILAFLAGCAALVLIALALVSWSRTRRRSARRS